MKRLSVTCQDVTVWLLPMILTVYISMKHFVVSISSHPKTPLLKRPTRSMPMFSGIWTHLYQKEATTFLQGQHFMNQNRISFLIGASYSLSEKQLLCMARAILRKSKVLVMDEVRHFVIYLPVTDSDDIKRRLLGLNLFSLVMICGLRVAIYSIDYATDELIGKTIRQ